MEREGKRIEGSWEGPDMLKETRLRGKERYQGQLKPVK